jgi:hypothetical protein
MILTTAAIICTQLLIACVAPAAAQRRGTRKRTGKPPAQVQAQPPQPTAPQMTEEEIAIEQELRLLSPLPASSKAAVRLAIEGLDRYVRLYRIRGYDENWVFSDEAKNLDALLKDAYAALPQKSFLQRVPQESYLRQVLIRCAQAIIDARRAELFYRCRCENDKLLALVTKYQLEGVAGVWLGDEIFKVAVELLAYADALARRAGIMSVPLQ